MQKQKYQIEDKVWVLVNDAIREGIVSGVRVSKTEQDEDGECLYEYHVQSEIPSYYYKSARVPDLHRASKENEKKLRRIIDSTFRFREEQIFSTKEALIESLLNDN